MTATQAAPPPPPPAQVDPDPLLAFTYDVLDKQYRVYAWSDGKMQALITVNAALLAGLFYIFDKSVPHSLLSYALPLLSGALLLSSLLVCLWHTVPRIDSRTPGGTHSLRTMKGIRGHTPAAYHAEVIKQNKPSLLEMNCRQIVGMNNNNYRSHDMMLWGVRFTIAGTLLLMSNLVLFSATKRSEGVPGAVARGTATSDGRVFNPDSISERVRVPDIAIPQGGAVADTSMK